MSDSESIKKMLRSVLQSSKTGVSISSLQSEYWSLCGESIPLKKLGFSKLEDYLRSISSVVRLEYRMGELKCFAAVCEETAHIAELVAKQKSSKKSGRSQVVNCRMRFKPSNPYMLNVRPRSSLRQPSAGGALNSATNRSLPHGGYRGFSASGDYRQLDQKLRSTTPVEHRQPPLQPSAQRKEKSLGKLKKPTAKAPEQASRPKQSQSSVFDVELVRTRLAQIVEKYYCGLWMSKLSGVYSEMFGETLHPQVLIDIEKWTQICSVEQLSGTNRVDRLIYPPLPPKHSLNPTSSTNSNPTSPTESAITPPISSHSSTPELSIPLSPSPVPKPRFSSTNPLAKPTFIYLQQPVFASSGKPLSSVTLRSPAHNPAIAPRLTPSVNISGGCKDNHNFSTAAFSAPAVGSSLQHGPSTLPPLKISISSTSDSSPPSKCSTVVVSTEVRQRIKELLSKYSHGLWAHALPKLFVDTYKTPFPEHLVDNLTLYLDIWTVEYPIPHDKNKAILYNATTTYMEAPDGEDNQQCRSYPLPSGLQVLGTMVPPCLVFPSDQYPSVLITDAKNSNAVTIRYVGENYSNAQEAMEDAMRSFYSQSSTCCPLPDPVVGQLVAVRGDDGDELARAQVMEIVDPNRVKVYYVDYGFSVETSRNNLLELFQDFLSLPFQATNFRLAGLEAFSSHPQVVSCIDQLAVGKILLMETLEPCQQSETPLAVLYDTSQDEDININSACLKSLQDETMNNPLTVNVTYQEVTVTNVCATGIIYCQLPSRGTARLAKLLEKTEAFFMSQVTSESLVSRPFSGKFCLSQYKGKWSRVEITNMYGNRVMEILFIDLGVTATVEVTDLREMPPLLFKDFVVIPPQAIKCCLADLPIPLGEWNPDAVRWVKEAVMVSENCKMKILKLEEHKGDRLVSMYLFIGVDGQEMDKSINHQLSQCWKKLTTQMTTATVTNRNSSKDTGLDALLEKLNQGFSVPNPTSKTQAHDRAENLFLGDITTNSEMKPLPLPPSLELPKPGQNMDVFVPVACHPGYFVLQPWQDLHKLVVLMGEMILYYNQTWKANTTTHIQKGAVYAARIDKNWHRVQVEGILSNGLVSVYELDHGKHELIPRTLVRPLIEEFRQLPFQAITAQLAGVTPHQWSEEACMLFRNHVEKRALVAHVESVQAVSEMKGELWECKLSVYLVDTTLEDRDLWIHNIMVDIDGELSSAA